MKWLGILVLIGAGISMAAGGSHGASGMGKIAGVVFGLVLALFATPLVNWVAAL